MTDKPLPSTPTSSGIGQWWKRNRHRSKQSSSPGQAELGLGTLPSPSGSRRTTYDLEALTKQLAAVDFGRVSVESKSSRNASNSVASEGSSYPPLFPPPMPSRPVTTLGLPPNGTNSQFSATSPPSKRAPVYALHVTSEDIQHSASAPQLGTYSQRSMDSSSRPHPDSPYHTYRPGKHLIGKGDVFGASSSITTFDPDPRSLERLPDRPAPDRSALHGQDLRRSTAQPYQSLSSFVSPLRSVTSYPEPPQSSRDTHIPGHQTPHHTSSTAPTAAQSQSKIPITPSRRPALPTPTSTPASTTSRSGKSPAASLASPFAVQCSGYTQKGQRCKKKVKSVAAYYAIRPPLNLDNSTRAHTPPLFIAPGKENEPLRTSSSLSYGAGSSISVGLVSGEEEKRFCNVHTGQISSPEGFYCRNTAVAGEISMSRGKWIQFSACLLMITDPAAWLLIDYIPDELEEQTKVLLRLTMESPLTNNVGSARDAHHNASHK
ncbi:hypothetical protein QFC19_001332 [Naganishia cerealis]|uniref:Uncharacterized protein n=1 Tax=Naganishia cerealis TaxID=610337 RepID=A0ACC2WI30_9TREE|nr:hypothetical protein QFC19_001332 [Naganishia cerealis]